MPQVGELLAKGVVLENTVTTRAEGRAERGDQGQEQGKHSRMMHEDGNRLPSEAIRAVTDGKLRLRMLDASPSSPAMPGCSVFSIACAPTRRGFGGHARWR